jgi:hypothetical protein
MDYRGDRRLRHGTARSRHGCRVRVFEQAGFLLLTLLLAVAGELRAEEGVPASAGASGHDSPTYFMKTSQLVNPLRPFEHLPRNAPIKVSAAVVTVPDPLETRLGRAFDVELAAIVSGFQASGYVLDGFAFTWVPKAPGSDGSYASSDGHARDLPSVLLFRRDDWRECAGIPDQGQYCGSNYYALFLVGETPTSGVHPEAFKRAARCAVELDGANRKDPSTFSDEVEKEDCGGDPPKQDEKPSVRWAALNCDRRLDVIGPSFSGSMESMAAALNGAAADAAGVPCETPDKEWGGQHLQIRLLSPSASIRSNEHVKYHAYVQAATTDHFKVDLQYTSLARSVPEQMSAVLAYLQPHVGHDQSVVVLSEETSFGRGAMEDFGERWQLGPGSAICEKGSDDGTVKDCWGHLVNVQFPPNIASIRAEHVKIKQNEDAQVRQMLPERLLELDLTGVDKGTDQPPTYQPTLSSRSDELMLYQTLDALKKRIRPAAVIIVATDVRDRLFLLSEVRDLLPGALPIVLEQDNLLEHPDYRDISRGSITIPAGRSLICLNSYNDLVPCPQSGAGQGAKVGPAADDATCPTFPRRFAFSTDYAANMFRAMVRLAKQQDASSDEERATFTAPREVSMTPSMLVATLAGFQAVGEGAGDAAASCNGIPEEKQDTLIVADARIQLQGPIYLAMALVFISMFVVPLWLHQRGSERPLLVFPVHRYALRWSRLKLEPTSKPVDKVGTVWLMAWMAVAAAGLGMAGYNVIKVLWLHTYDGSNLAHGRALIVLIGLCLAYACLIMLTMLRVREWDAHCRALSRAVGDTPFGMRLQRHGVGYAVLSALILLVCLCLSVYDPNPVSADHSWVAELAGLFALCGSAFFLALFVEAYDRLCRISMELDTAVALIQRECGAGDWPNPVLLGERPTSPFNIAMRLKNFLFWRQHDYALWAENVQILLAGKWILGCSPSAAFETWQGLLVAEMKFAVTAMRTCAWCSVLGATLAMLEIQVYPSAYPRLQATASVILLGLGFAAIVYVVLRLEKDSLLGKMFTTGKDSLTFGGALSALWPKLLALASILIAAFLPSVWGWLGGLVKAINSLH